MPLVVARIFFKELRIDMHALTAAKILLGGLGAGVLRHHQQELNQQCQRSVVLINTPECFPIGDGSDAVEYHKQQNGNASQDMVGNELAVASDAVEHHKRSTFDEMVSASSLNYTAKVLVGNALYVAFHFADYHNQLNGKASEDMVGTESVVASDMVKYPKQHANLEYHTQQAKTLNGNASQGMVGTASVVARAYVEPRKFVEYQELQVTEAFENQSNIDNGVVMALGVARASGHSANAASDSVESHKQQNLNGNASQLTEGTARCVDRKVTEVSEYQADDVGSIVVT
ncbi:unnamed protein product, partial [Prorocentrum cordatum]